MDLQNSYVYRGIRRAALQRLFSWKRVLSCFCLLIFIVFLWAFLSPSGSSNRKDRMPEFFLIVLAFGLWFLIDIVDIIRNVAALIFPENSIAATRYADIISFKKICTSVEAQLLQPLIDFDHLGVIALADFIIYKRYGDFAVIPYCAIKSISPGVIKWAGLWPKINTVVIQNDLGQSHTIICKNPEKRDQIFLIWMMLCKHRAKSGSTLQKWVGKRRRVECMPSASARVLPVKTSRSILRLRKGPQNYRPPAPSVHQVSSRAIATSKL